MGGQLGNRMPASHGKGWMSARTAESHGRAARRNIMECASCHDPHNRYNLRALLVMPNGRSELCYTCHRL